MKGNWFFGCVFVLTAVMACNSSSPDAGMGPQLEIIHRAGTIPDQSWNFLPYPAHYGMIDGDHVLLLSKAPNIGRSRSIVSIGMLTTVEKNETENWIIANDAHEDYKIKGLNNIDDLMTNHNGIKSTLERWITNREAIGQVQLKGWKAAPSLPEYNNQ